MNILLIAPHSPDSYLAFKSIMHIIDKKAVVPPLGLVTVSALLPKSWNKRLVDLNVTELRPKDILWADYVFVTAIYIQKKSVQEIIEMCKRFGTKIVAGGPMFTQEYEAYIDDVDHLVLNEAEITLPMFLEDLKTGQPKKIYRTEKFADMTKSPIPDYSLLNVEDYVYMNIQISRGCPFSCEFCEITTLLGHKMRMKTTQQVINELDALYDLGWRGNVFVVDDNIVGNKKRMKEDILPAMRLWAIAHNYPFSYNTQSSIDLADDSELTAMLVDVGFSSVLIGIETLDEKAFEECNKKQNTNRNLMRNVRRLQIAGLMVSAGFIVGFDSDTDTIFQRQINFIEKSGIVTAIVGLLNAPKNSPLYKRLESENRIIDEIKNTGFHLNFKPVMDPDELIGGYRRIICGIYNGRAYYKRVRTLLHNYTAYKPSKFGPRTWKTFFKLLYTLGVVDSSRKEFWKLLAWTLRHRPQLFADAMVFSVCGLHFRNIFGLDDQGWIRTNTDSDGQTQKEGAGRRALNMLKQIMRKKGEMKNMTGFTSELKFQDLGYTPRGKAVYRLLSPLVFNDGTQEIIVPEGFETDLASVPRVPIAYMTWGDRAHREAVLHDYLYSIGAVPDLSREACDELFRQAMISRGNPSWVYQPMYWGVRLAGWNFYKKVPLMRSFTIQKIAE